MINFKRKKEKYNLENSNLIQLYTLYSSQAADYDRSSIVMSIGTIGFISTIFVIFVNVSSDIYNNEVIISKQSYVYMLLLVLINIIPGIITMFLYIFSMNCRKVSMCRAYLMYLENKLNSKIGKNILTYNNLLDNIFMDRFIVNRQGPIILSLIFLIFYFISIFLSISLLYKIFFTFKSIVISIFSIIFYIIFILTCIIYSAYCIKALSSNTKAANDMKVSLNMIEKSKDFENDCKNLNVDPF